MALNEHQYSLIKNTLIAVLSLIIIVTFSYIFAEILAMLIVSFLIALIFNPVVDFIERRGLPRLAAVLFVFFLTGFLIFSAVSFLMPKIVNQFNLLAAAITPENFKSLINQFESSFKKIFPFMNSVSLADKLTGFFQNMILGWVNNITNIIYSIFSLIAIVVIVPFMTFFLLKDNTRLVKGLVNIMPNKYFEVSYWVIHKISIELGRYVRGWILDAFLVGLLSGCGLALLGIQNAASIGFIAGVGHLIPYFGPIIGGIPAILISIVQFGNFSMLPNIVLLFLLVYTIDNGFIQPHVFSKSTDMHPLIIILLIIIGSQTIGILGMLFAVPAATVIKTASREIYLGYKNYKIIRA
ncbi:MAG: AI-2E family transporter [Bacteroidota bacterium]